MCHLCRHPRFRLKATQGHISSSVVFVPDLALGCGVERAGTGGRGVVSAGTEVAVLLPEIWAASGADFSLDLCAQVWCQATV